MQFIVTFYFIYIIIIIYYFLYIGTYFGDEPPQQDEEMEEEAIEKLAGVQRLIMPCRLDHRVYTVLEYHICAIYSTEDVSCAHAREIKEDLHLFYIWCALSSDIT